MKILTHKLVIYNKGWRFEWEAKDSYRISITGRELVLWVALVCLLYFT